jgi:membrane-bound lytic murein transglycosylase D
MIPRAGRSPAAYTLTADARAERQRDAPRAGQQQAHVVKSGETLWTIARRYDVELRDLARWNSMAPGDVLSVGRRLVVWTPTSGVPAESQSERVRRVTYQVRRGDSLSSIASRFRVRVAELLQWNSLTADRYLQPGQRLVMYIDVTRQST